jgi:Tetratricopeptide repeat
MRLRLNYFIISLLVLSNMGVRAANKLEFTPLALQAYNSILDLKINDAKSKIIQIKKTDPTNLITLYLENFIDCITIYVTENEYEFKRLEKNKDLRLDKLKKANIASPYFYFFQAEINLLWALTRMKFKEYYTAFNEASTAYGLLEKNQKLYPGFLPNKKSQGVLHAIVGSIPSSYKWGVKLLSGMNGTVEQGQKELEELINYSKTNDFIYEKETVIIYSFLLLNISNESEGSWKMINSKPYDTSKSMLMCYAKANVALSTGRNDEGLQILLNKPNSKEYYPVPYLNFMTGLAKLHKNESDANIWFTKFLNEFKGKSNVKEAYQKIAWSYLLAGNMRMYKQSISLCLTKGNDESGSDKNAYKEAASGEAPEINLLKARLLFDGGYYQKAFDLLNKKIIAGEKNVMEYNYRMGRIDHLLKNYNECIIFYKKAIEVGKNSTYYYPCNAALQLGIVYELLKQNKEAIKYYHYCLDLDPDDYANELHTKAKAGLGRLDK